MNGPFSEWYGSVLDKDGERVASMLGPDDETEKKNCEMIVAALNAVFYAAVATGQIKEQK